MSITVRMTVVSTKWHEEKIIHAHFYFIIASMQNIEDLSIASQVT